MSCGGIGKPQASHFPAESAASWQAMPAKAAEAVCLRFFQNV
jgi:hypothetical protein